MKFSLSLAAVAVGAAFAADTSSSVTPVQKVVQMLEAMKAKGQEEKQAEQVQFAAYKQFCDDTSVEKDRSIAEAAELIEVLKADIGKAASDITQLTKAIAEHESDASEWKEDQKKATEVRQMEKVDYDATHKDYSESIDALGRAVAVLKKQAYDRDQTAFVQVKALTKMKLLPEDAKRAIDLFLTQDSSSTVAAPSPAGPPSGLVVDEEAAAPAPAAPAPAAEAPAETPAEAVPAAAAPQASGYEFQSNGVVDMLEKLQDKFTEEKTTLEKTEMNAKHAYDMLTQDLTAQIQQAEKEIDDKSETKAKRLHAKASAEGDLKDTTNSKTADGTYLSELTATCEQKATDFESRQSLRAEELEAIAKAVEIISSTSVSAHAAKHLPALAQKATALVQLRATASLGDQQRAAEYLASQGEQLNSRMLSMLANRVTADPFVKVKKMIRDLVVRLMEEANEEAEHKGWCDKELATNAATRKEKTEAVETLTSEIDELKSSIAKLTEEVAQLTKDSGELDAAMAAATELRSKEKAKNEATVQDAVEAQTAVAQALTVLKDFYAKAGEAASFVQSEVEQTPPPVFDSPYKGMQSENGGVVGMLEVIESDFARLQAETAASEATARKEYDTFMSDSKVDKTAKSTDVEHKIAKKQDQSQALTEKTTDIEGTQKELDAALGYFDKLKPSCVDAGVSYEDRVARRKEEIQSLQEALKILSGEALA